MSNLNECMDKLGYRFREDGLLRRALTHSSLAVEQHRMGEDNERLEYLGDAVLEHLVSRHLYDTHPEMREGALTRLRSSLVCEEALAAGQNVILDGYPRDDWQASWIVENGDAKKIDGAIILKVSHDELWNRLQDRAREDDTKESIEKRWNVFEHTIDSMTKTLAGAGVKIQEVDGEGSIEEVTARIEKVLADWGII